MEHASGSEAGRPQRRDAVANRERILEAAVALIAREGFTVPVADIAKAAGVGVGTFYRSFPDREALLGELELRAYRQLDALLDQVEAEGLIGLVAVRRYLLGSVELGDRLVLPLRGAPVVLGAAATAARDRIDARLERFLDQARSAGAVSADVNATDVIVCSSLVGRHLRGGPLWDRARRRHVESFVAGLVVVRTEGDAPITRAEVEAELSS